MTGCPGAPGRVAGWASSPVNGGSTYPLSSAERLPAGQPEIEALNCLPMTGLGGAALLAPPGGGNTPGGERPNPGPVSSDSATAARIAVEHPPQGRHPPDPGTRRGEAAPEALLVARKRGEAGSAEQQAAGAGVVVRVESPIKPTHRRPLRRGRATAVAFPRRGRLCLIQHRSILRTKTPVRRSGGWHGHQSRESAAGATPAPAPCLGR
jgi:hypothetical protein